MTNPATALHVFRSPTLEAIADEAREREIAAGALHSSVFGWRLASGHEFLRIGSRVLIALPSGDVIEGEQGAEESSRQAFDRLTAARAIEALAARADAHPRGLSGVLADDAARGAA